MDSQSPSICGHMWNDARRGFFKHVRQSSTQQNLLLRVTENSSKWLKMIEPRPDLADIAQDGPGCSGR